MKTEWTTRKLSELADIQTGPFGSQLHKEDYVDNGTPIVTVEHLGARIFSKQNLPMVSDSDKERLNKYILREGDIVFSRVGSVDRCSFVDREYDGWMFSGRCLRVRPKLDMDALFLYYYFCLEDTKNYVRNIAVGATMPSINTRLLGEVQVTYPAIGEQRKIAETLSKLDSKIELNQRINENLEQQAQSIYRQMFINTENAGRNTCSANECFDISIGKTPPRKESQWFSVNSSDIVWVSISDMGSCGPYISDSSEYLTAEAINQHHVRIVPDGTILLSFKLTVGRIAITDGEMTTNEAIAHFKMKDCEIREYLYCYLKSFDFQTMGSTSSIATAVNSKMIKAMPFIIPAKDELETFHRITSPMFEQIKFNLRENKKLDALRDALLPRLMSGEIELFTI